VTRHYLITRYYQATPGERTVYWFISTPAGSVDAFNGTTMNATTGNKVNIKDISNVGAPGTYVFTPVILTNGNHMLPQSGFTFIVE
jgi:hypothetical protein